ncbi:MAG: glycosyltransferase [Planctomycetota bacterium]|nr:glycosyltransferase [Planctomycetota bacterium]
MQNRSRVAALVLNSVSQDIRVCKEADSLAAAGFEVTVIGMVDRTASDVETVRRSGATIHRVNMAAWAMHRKYLREANRSLLAVIALVIATVGIFVLSLGLLLDEFWSQIWAMLGFSGTVIVAFLVVLIGWASRRTLRYQRSARKKSLAILADRPRPSSSRKRRDITAETLGNLRAILASGKFFVFAILRVLSHRRRSAFIRSHFFPELERIQPEIVHCHDLPTLPIGIAWCRRNPSTRLVFDSHELYEQVAGLSTLERWYWRRQLRRFAGRVDGFITVNESIAAEHARRYPSLPPAVVVRNATMLPKDEPRDRGLLRAAAKVRSDERILLYQGGYAKERGLEALIRAAPELPQGWVLVMMGWGNLQDHLQTIARAVDPLQERIRFIPPAKQEVLRDWTAGADLGVIPYENTCLNHWFCSPNKLWEYPVAGVPILASPFPELRREIEGAGIGRLLPEALDGPGLRRVVESIDSEALEEMKTACHEFARRDHWGVYQDRLLDLYRRLEKTGATESRQLLEVKTVSAIVGGAEVIPAGNAGT